MMIPIRCFTCGRLIGEKFVTFQSRTKSGEDPAKVLDDLGLKRYCCRRMLISSVDVIDQVLPFFSRKADVQ
ncbi:MAG: DNA-directed RNA polymerase subunit N [archaeon]|nr:MAG: DNA-directed RNA polymerase subunit N [archaeon]